MQYPSPAEESLISKNYLLLALKLMTMILSSPIEDNHLHLATILTSRATTPNPPKIILMLSVDVTVKACVRYFLSIFFDQMIGLQRL